MAAVAGLQKGMSEMDSAKFQHLFHRATIVQVTE
jgi:hypothetical protein